MNEKDVEKGDIEKITEPSRESSISVSPVSPKAPEEKEASTKSAALGQTTGIADPGVQGPALSIKSLEPPPAKPVPINERRGLLARLSLIPEVDEPKNYSPRAKWTITFIVAIAGAAAPTGSGILLRKFVSDRGIGPRPRD